MANSVDPGQTAPFEQSDLGLHCLLRSVCVSTYNFHHKFQIKDKMSRESNVGPLSSLVRVCRVCDSINTFTKLPQIEQKDLSKFK